MPRSVKFTGYILSLNDERRITVRLDTDHISRMTNILSRFYERTTFKDTLVVNVSNARFNVSFEWNDLKDLLGCHVEIEASLCRYNYWSPREVSSEDNDSPHRLYVQYKGVSISANKLSNITV